MLGPHTKLAPGFSATGPRSRQSFGDQLISKGASTAHNYAQFTAILVFVFTLEDGQLKWPLVEQTHKAVSCTFAESSLCRTSRLADFRRVYLSFS